LAVGDIKKGYFVFFGISADSALDPVVSFADNHGFAYYYRENLYLCPMLQKTT